MSRVPTDSEVRQELAVVAALLGKNSAQAAMDHLEGVIRSISDSQLDVFLPDINSAIDRFFPNRRRSLRQVLSRRTGVGHQGTSSRTPEQTPSAASAAESAASTVPVYAASPSVIS